MQHICLKYENPVLLHTILIITCQYVTLMFTKDHCTISCRGDNEPEIFSTRNKRKPFLAKFLISKTKISGIWQLTTHLIEQHKIFQSKIQT